MCLYICIDSLIVWQKLEEQNPQFFKAYQLRLQIKDQISQFNHLVSEQANAMRYYHSLEQQQQAAAQPNQYSQIGTPTSQTPLISQIQIPQPATPTQTIPMMGVNRNNMSTTQIPEMYNRPPQMARDVTNPDSLSYLLLDTQPTIGSYSQFEDNTLSLAQDIQATGNNTGVAYSNYAGNDDPLTLNLDDSNAFDDSEAAFNQNSLWYSDNNQRD